MALDQSAVDDLVYAHLQPTAQIHWPLLDTVVGHGTQVWLKHENHNPTGAFKVRGGLVYMHQLKQNAPDIDAVIAATRGNHGQSVALAAQKHGMTCRLFVPVGNSVEKNAAMTAYGAELVEVGEDFQDAFEAAQDDAQSTNGHLLPSFDETLVAGVSTYAFELFKAQPTLDAVYVPVGLGSGICGVIRARDMLGLNTEIIGVVPTNAAAYQLSFDQGQAVSTNSANTIADGTACRIPNQEALGIILAGAQGFITVTENEIKQAMRDIYRGCHNIAEGAAAAPFAAIKKDAPNREGQKLAAIISGGNIDQPLYQKVLSG